MLKIEFLEKLNWLKEFRKLSINNYFFRQYLIEKEKDDIDDGKGAHTSIVL